MGNIELSIIIVNHNSTSLLFDCLDSIKDELNNISYDVTVIDSGSRKEEIENLKELYKYENVNLVIEEENIGYAKAVNRGLRTSKGIYVLITNPDVVYLKDSIITLIKSIERLPDCGAVSPKTWWDGEKTFLLPCNEFISPYVIFKKKIANKFSFLKRMLLKKWLKKTIYYWMAEEPVRVDLASGSCIMTKRDIIDKIGDFDERYPLYFEDIDWFLRVKKAGYKLYYVPDAEIVHFYNQSAKLDVRSSSEKFSLSMQMYIKKHFKIEDLIFGPFNNKIINSESGKRRFKDSGYLNEPFDIHFKDNYEKLILMSPNENMIPSAGSFCKNDNFKINKDIWVRLSEGRYFIKIIAINGFKEMDAFSFYKKQDIR